MAWTTWAAAALLCAAAQPCAAVRLSDAARGSWDVLLEGIRKDQAELEKEAVAWVPQSSGFTSAWAADLEKTYGGVIANIKKENNMLKEIASKKNTLCPSSCQFDAMKQADFSMSKEAGELKAQKTSSQGKLAELKAQQSEVVTLKERLASYITAANVLKFKAKEELERFEAILTTKIEPRTKAAALITTDKLGHAKGGAKRPTMAGLKKPLEMEVKRLADEKKHCESLKGFETTAKAARAKMTSDQAAEMSRLRGKVDKYNGKATHADDKTDGFAQVNDAFAAICKKEKEGYADMVENKLSGLEPKELRQAFEAEVDDHHGWWKDTCGNMDNLAGGVTGWLANCKQMWQRSVLGAEESILNEENRPAKKSLDGLTKSVSDMCDKDFAAKQAKLDAKLKDVTDFCEEKVDGKKNCGSD